MWQGLQGIAAAWQVFVDTVNLALPQHWWSLQGIIGQLAGGAAAVGTAPTSGMAPSVAIPTPTANQLLLGIAGQLVNWGSLGGGGGGPVYVGPGPISIPPPPPGGSTQLV